MAKAQPLVPDAVADVPPAAKLVYLVLRESDEQLRQKDIVECTRLSKSAVKESIGRLEDADVPIERVPNVGDLRHTAYRLPESFEDDSSR